MGGFLSSAEKPEQKGEAEEVDDDEPDDWYLPLSLRSC